MDKKDLLYIIRPARMAHFALMSILGAIVFQRNLSISMAILLSPILSAILWQITSMINDLFDTDIDAVAHPERPLVSGRISREAYVRSIISLIIISLTLSALLGIAALILSITFIILAILYSVPPFRMRNRLWGTVFVGLGSGIAYFIGYLSSFWPSGGSFMYINPLTPLGLRIGIFILIALSIAPNINSYEDIEGDMRAGVRNIYTVLGPENGKKVVSFLILLIFLLPPMVLFSYLNLTISAISGIAGAAYFYKMEDSKGIFALYFINLIYYMVYFLYPV